MTAGGEQLLTAYLLSTGEIEEAGHFTGWYAAIRNGSAGSAAVAPPEAALSCPGVPPESGAPAANQEPCHHHRNRRLLEP